MTAATRVPEEVDVAETVRAMEERLERAESVAAVYRAALERVVDEGRRAHGLIPKAGLVSRDTAAGWLLVLAGVAFEGLETVGE